MFRHLRLTSDESWGLLVLKDRSEVLAPVVGTLGQMALVDAVLVAVVLLLVLGFSLRIARPVTRLAEVAGRIQMGAGQVRATPHGSRELRLLAGSFNAMVDHLQDWNRELEEKVAERSTELLQARDLAMAANRAKSEFLAHMSHEIRTPMNSVIGMTRLAARTATQPRQQDQLRKVLEAADHLMGVINNILDYSKVEAGKLLLERVPFELDPLLEQLADVISLRLQNRDVELLFDVKDEVPRSLVGDPVKLSQVLINLLGNAAKFTQHGQVLLTVRRLDAGGPQALLDFAVKDTGIGMAPEQLDRLFDAFTQADASITRQYGGTGLGLAISKQLVALMGGRIEVASERGVGTTLAFTLALGVGVAPALPEGDGAPVTFQRILVVDDHPLALEIVADLVERSAHEVIRTTSGAGALELLEQAESPFDLVISDYKMPGMDGIELARRIRAHPDLDPGLPVLLVTGHDLDTLNDLADGLHLQGCLAKPLNASHLYNKLAAIRGALGRSVLPARSMRGPRLDLTALHGARLLLVDDFALNREVALGYLAEARVWVDVAEDGQMAVDMVKARPYDLVLMDIQMPVMDGLSATRLLRQLPEGQGLPIIAMTAHAMTQDRDMSLAAGMNDHVVKPIDPQLLFRALLRWIDPAALEGRSLPEPVDAPGEGEEQAHFLARLPRVACLDWQAGLGKTQGSVVQYRKMARTFRRDYAQAPGRFRRAMATGVDEAIRIIAHNLKSSATYLGALDLARQAAALETGCRGEDPEALQRLLPLVAGRLEEVLGALAEAAPCLEPEGLPGVATGATVLDAAALGRDFQALARMLEDGDSRAEDLCQHLQGLLPAEALGPFRRIGELVDDIEFEIALEALRALAGTLGVALTERT